MPNKNDIVLNKQSEILVNGEWTDSRAYLDRGLNFGDGFFETLLIDSGQAPLWRFHLDRLTKAIGVLGIDIEPSVVQSYTQQFFEQTTKADVSILKIIVTRGLGGTGYSPQDCVEPQVILQAKHFEKNTAYCINGVELGACQVHLPLNENLSGIKHLSRLDYVLAAKSFGEIGQRQPMLMDTQGNVVESLHHNVFFVSGDCLHTPDLRYCGVAGVMREFILNIGKDTLRNIGIKMIKQDHYSKDFLYKAQEVFICNSVRGIWPVTAVDQIQKPVGPVTRALQQWIRGELGDAYEC